MNPEDMRFVAEILEGHAARLQEKALENAGTRQDLGFDLREGRIQRALRDGPRVERIARQLRETAKA